MKNLLSLFCCFFFVSLSMVFGQQQTVSLSIPNDFCVTNAPQVGTSIDYNVTLHLTECINMFGASPGETATSLQMGNNQMASGQSASTVAIALLHSVGTSGNGSSYNFGPNCGENQADDANVTVVYGNETASLDQLASASTNFSLDIGGDVMRTSNNAPVEGPASQSYLMVQASENNTATISIGQDDRQGQCFVLIFDAQTGAAVATLNPKAADQSFVANKSVYVMPIIKPKTRAEDGKPTITWEVGDPKRNGKVIVEEEG